MTETAETTETDAPAEPAPLTFADLGLGDAVLKALRDVGYETPSPIQAETIPLLLEGRDVVGLAQTGTGKTAAFALPILSQLDLAQKTPQALVLAPTRELALQVCEAFERYAAHVRGVHVLPVYGGQGYGVLPRNARALRLEVCAASVATGRPAMTGAAPEAAGLAGADLVGAGYRDTIGIRLARSLRQAGPAGMIRGRRPRIAPCGPRGDGRLQAVSRPAPSSPLPQRRRRRRW